MHLTGKQLVRAYRTMCTIQKCEERVHKAFAKGPIRGFVYSYANTHRAHAHSIEEGAQS